MTPKEREAITELKECIDSLVYAAGKFLKPKHAMKAMEISGHIVTLIKDIRTKEKAS